MADGTVGTGAAAITTADAVGTIGLLIDRNIEFAGLLTLTTLGTCTFINMKPIEGNGIKETVDGSQRTEVAAKWAVDPHE